MPDERTYTEWELADMPRPVDANEPTRCAQCGRITKTQRPDSVCGRCMDEIYRVGSGRGGY